MYVKTKTKKELNLHTKGKKKTLDILAESYWSSTPWFVFDHCLLHFAKQNYGIQETLYVKEMHKA